MLANQPRNRRPFQDLLTAASFLCCLFGPALAAGQVTCVPRIVDGDTVAIGDTKIRLQGIDAPETDQVCLNQKDRKWTCGIAARDELEKFTAGRPWTCAITGSDKYGRSLGRCAVDGQDVERWMVRSGWALAFVRYSSDYVGDQDAARRASAGLWSGAFIAPWDWRHRNGKTEILGALSVPRDAQKILLGAASAAEAPSPNCIIKANISRRGCIFHQPGDLWYGKMNMHSTGKRWFCSVDEAEAAGCRPPAR